MAKRDYETIQKILEGVTGWAAARTDIQAVALVGSYARGTARADADLDLVLLADQPGELLQDPQWITTFGPVARQQVEDYGKVTALRAWYADGIEVEFGLAAPSWAALPLDPSTRRVFDDGLEVLFEREQCLSRSLRDLEQAGALYASLAEAVRQRADPEGAALNRRWFKNPDHRSYGLRAPDFREIARSHRKAVRQLSLEARLELARRLVESGFAEDASLANWVLALSTDRLGPEHFELLGEHVERFHGWDATDDFCLNVLQPLLWKHPQETLELLREWNRSGNLWKRRASAVVFTRKVGASGRFTAETLALCENLVWDAENLVQKGVGWALKDSLRGDRAQVLAYIKDLRRRGAPATITLYAIRDLKGGERRAVLKIRRDYGPERG